MPAKKKASKQPVSLSYYVVEITRPGGYSHLVTARQSKAKETARVAEERDGRVAEIYFVNLTTDEKRIAFLKAILKDPTATWKKAARPITLRSADNQPEKQTDGNRNRDTTESRTGKRQTSSKSAGSSTGERQSGPTDDEDNDAFWSGLSASEEDEGEEEGLFQI